MRALSSALCSNSCVTRMPSSSAVRSRKVCRRQLWVSCVAVDDPEHDIRIPTSMASSMFSPASRLPHPRSLALPPDSRSLRRCNAPSSAMPAAIARRARPRGVSHSDASSPPRRRRKPRHRVEQIRERRRARATSSSDDSAASTSARTTAGSTGRPSSDSIDEARSASSGGYDAGLMLMPMPRMTYWTPSADDEASASMPAIFRRREGPDDPGVTTSFGHLISSGNPVAARMPSATATPPASVRYGVAATSGSRSTRTDRRQAANTRIARDGRGPTSAPRRRPSCPAARHARRSRPRRRWWNQFRGNSRAGRRDPTAIAEPPHRLGDIRRQRIRHPVRFRS